MNTATRDVTHRKSIVNGDAKFESSTILEALKQIAAEAEKTRVIAESIGVTRDSFRELMASSGRTRPEISSATATLVRHPPVGVRNDSFPSSGISEGDNLLQKMNDDRATPTEQQSTEQQAGQHQLGDQVKSGI